MSGQLSAKTVFARRVFSPRVPPVLPPWLQRRLELSLLAFVARSGHC
jgi:hypothetical protein